MAKQSEQNVDRYNDIFPSTLRSLLEKHPEDGKPTTYKALGEAVGVRQQTISQYAAGITQPTADVVLKIAKHFNVSVDYLLTGISSENKKISEELGLSEQAITLLKRAHKFTKEEHPGNKGTIPYLDELLSDGGFYQFLEEIEFKIESLKSVQDNREKVQKKYDGLNVEDYYIWSLQMFVQEFIRNEIVRLGLEIDVE